MKKLITIIIILIFSAVVKAQSFEGVITYCATYELKGKFLTMKDEIMEKLKEQEDYFDTLRVYIKQDQYKKVTNASSSSSTIYKPVENKIFNLKQGFEYVTIADANEVTSSKIQFPEPEITYVDSIKYIAGIPCETIKISWGKMGEEWYFYNEKTAVMDPRLYEQHKYEYLDVILKNSASYPLEIIKSLNNIMFMRLTMVSVEEKEIAEIEFKIPELKKADKEMVKIMGAIFTSKVMKIKK